jgi:hypothetical protein
MQERQRFEENWKSAFEGAEMAPSDHLWANIELDLVGDESKKMKKRVVFYQRLAAALVLVSASLGIYVWNSREVIENVDLTAIDGKKTESQRATVQPSTASVEAGDKNETPVAADKKGSQGMASKNRLPDKASEGAAGRSNEARQGITRSAHMDLAILADSASQLGNSVVVSKKEIANEQANIPALEQTQQLEVAQVQEMTVEEATRIVEEYLKPVEEKSEKKKKESESLWLAMGGSAGSYNPSSANTAGGSTFANNMMQAGALDRSGQTSQNSLGAAYSLGVSVGKKISERWVVQSGLNYINQSIDYSSNVLMYNASNQAQLSVPEYLNDGLKNSSMAAITTTNPYTINSAIEMVSIPVQAGYLIIDRKIGWQVNGGFSSDLFLRNTLTDESGQTERFSQSAGKGSPYRSVNWSGLMNTELSYKVSENYRVSVVPGLRYGITSVLKDGTSTPLILDIGFRFRYLFK